MKTNGKRANTSGKTYPESSSRQALRGQRRAQGGPGITTGPNPTSKSAPQLVETLEVANVTE